MEYDDMGLPVRDFPVTLVRNGVARTADTEADIVAAQWDGYQIQGSDEEKVADQMVAAETPFDPSAKSADEVNAYLADADADEHIRVLDAERAGKARKGVLGE